MTRRGDVLATGSGLLEWAVRRFRLATNWEVTAASALTSGRMTWKFRIVSKKGSSFILRAYPPGREHICQFEPHLILRMLARGMRVPRVLHWACDSEGPEPAFVIYEELPGVSLDLVIDKVSKRQLEGVCRSLIEQLSLLATLRLEGYGELKAGGRAGASETWPKFVNEVLLNANVSSNNALLHHAVEKVQDALSWATGPACPSLAWGDISPENVIVQVENYQMMGLIDFEGMLALEPAASYGYLKARYFGSRFYEACFDAADLSCFDERLLSFYAIVRALRISRFLSDALPTGASRDSLELFLPGLRPSLLTLAEGVRDAS